MLEQRPRPKSKPLYRWSRNLHLYAGLFVCPAVLIYAFSAIVFVHALLPWGGSAAAPVERRTLHVEVPDADDGLAAASQVRAQIGVRGEIGYVSRKADGARLDFPIESPGRATRVHVDLTTGVATVETRRTGAWDAMIWLHKMPGPHNVAIRGNWVVTRLWRWLADATVYVLLFLSVTGIYLWIVLRAERRSGLVALGAGVLSFTAIVLAMVA